MRIIADGVVSGMVEFDLALAYFGYERRFWLYRLCGRF